MWGGCFEIGSIIFRTAGGILESLEQVATEEVKPAEEAIQWKRFIKDILETLVLAAVLFIGINAVSARVRVDGFSMRPTLEDGEFVLVSRMSYKFSEYERGDIVVFHFPLDPKEELIKRVIGLPGDHVRVEGGQVFLNGQLLEETYIAEAPRYSGEWVVTEGFLFVLGDNRNNSNDSKDWGLLPQENVVGKAVLIYWPPPMWGALDHAGVSASQ
ncbi:MAG: signal peptidase I [Chloroflexi bacterium]|nr:signal peptidase I [Chloroflexi bacterium CFX1]MCQ3952860.1 signal peptidase I [Chloroflexota bacterium]MDL1920089.1 signal peptidase I [Chloroflexi bacterium CFX5]RIK54516.1 MAG: signal peptidase I [Chloroflexota bacterium]